ncbi:DUF4269 domain-containing protein [Thalassobacillus hwangdonensis]|uniref:DUF4269 domain-containing protein n=1 Tax=Thalassobacillus hwangdonensis TaxID=546108 RepID=A0ABW3L4Q0_9BACI
MLDSMILLKNGDAFQKQVYDCIQQLNIMDELTVFRPVVCGTVPIDIYLGNSDVDIIMGVDNLEHFSDKIRSLYGDQTQFRLKSKRLRGNKVVKANFNYKTIPFELFGQSVPTHKQNAYLHMVIEYDLLKKEIVSKQKVIQLKRRGLSTEAAFCDLLSLSGDPYESLLEFGKERNII